MSSSHTISKVKRQMSHLEKIITNADHNSKLNFLMCKKESLPINKGRIVPIPIGKMIKELGQKRKWRMSFMEGCLTALVLRSKNQRTVRHGSNPPGILKDWKVKWDILVLRLCSSKHCCKCQSYKNSTGLFTEGTGTHTALKIQDLCPRSSLLLQVCPEDNPVHV